MEPVIIKLNQNEVGIKKVVEHTDVRSYETLMSQKEGILAQQAQEHAAMAERDTLRDKELAIIEEALNTGIEAKPVVYPEEILSEEEVK
jgi:hypothetical protein